MDKGGSVDGLKNDIDAKPAEDTVSKKRKAEWFDIDEDHNTYVYVSGLPNAMTEEEFVDLMKKYGIIAKKSIHGSPYNVKLYKNPDGSFKGDALCKFVRRESVELSLTHLDGYQYDQDHVIKCERAKFQMKGSYDPSKKPRVDAKTKMKQKKTVEKLLSWEAKRTAEIKQKKVILKHLFTPEELLEDITLRFDLQEDVESKCAETVGAPKKVDIFDKHPEGVVAVTFMEASQAEACVKMLNNQFYAGRVVTAELWDGKTKYRIQETDEEEEKRLERWKQEIASTNDSEIQQESDEVGNQDATKIE